MLKYASTAMPRGEPRFETNINCKVQLSLTKLRHLVAVLARAALLLSPNALLQQPLVQSALRGQENGECKPTSTLLQHLSQRELLELFDACDWMSAPLDFAYDLVNSHYLDTIHDETELLVRPIADRIDKLVTDKWDAFKAECEAALKRYEVRSARSRAKVLEQARRLVRDTGYVLVKQAPPAAKVVVGKAAVKATPKVRAKAKAKTPVSVPVLKPGHSLQLNDGRVAAPCGTEGAVPFWSLEDSPANTAVQNLTGSTGSFFGLPFSLVRTVPGGECARAHHRYECHIDLPDNRRFDGVLLVLL